MAKITRKATEKTFETKFYISKDSYSGSGAFLSEQKPISLDGVFVMGGTASDYEQMHSLSRFLEEILLGGDVLMKGTLAEVTIKAKAVRYDTEGNLVDLCGNVLSIKDKDYEV